MLIAGFTDRRQLYLVGIPATVMRSLFEPRDSLPTTMQASPYRPEFTPITVGRTLIR
jgi:hypothetical protein